MRTAQDSKMMVQLKPELYLMPCRACEPCSKTLDQLCMCIYIYIYVCMYIYTYIYIMYIHIMYIYIRLSPCFRNHGFGLRRNIFGANDCRVVFTGNMFYWMLVSLVVSQSNFLKVLCIRNESPVAFLREAGIGRAAVAASWDPIGGILLPSLFPPRASMVVAHACKVLQLP